MVNNGPTKDNGRDARLNQFRLRLEKLRQSRKRKLLDIPEVVGLSVSAALLLAAVLSYLFFLSPERSRLKEREEERSRIQALLRTSSEGVKRGENTQATVDEIINSVQRFETDHLSSLQREGSTALIEELNRLIRVNNLRIASPVSFVQFEEVIPGTQQQGQTITGAVKALQNVFPGLGISLTVEGEYSRLRNFIKDVESDRQFIVINSVTLEGVKDSSAPAANTDEEESGNSPVSLRLEMAAYYRRAANTSNQNPPASN